MQRGLGLQGLRGESGKENLENFIDRIVSIGHDNDRNIMTKITQQNATGQEKIRREKNSGEMTTLFLFQSDQGHP